MKLAALFFTVALVVSVTADIVTAQDEAIAQAYRTVNVRSGPSTEYEIVGQLTNGSEAPITGRSNDMNDWLRIEFRGVEGWVAYFTVTVLGDTDDLPIVTPRVSIELQGNVIAPTPIPSLTPFHLPGQTFVTTYRRVNVRNGPGTEYTVIGSLEAGSSADVSGRTTDDEWLRIAFDDQDGWVAFFVVSLNGSLDSVDVVASDDEPVEVIARYNVNLHSAPQLSSTVVGIVPYNTPLLAEARSDSDEIWLEVSYDGRDGWLMSNLISVTAGDPDNLPFQKPTD